MINLNKKKALMVLIIVPLTLAEYIWEGNMVANGCEETESVDVFIILLSYGCCYGVTDVMHMFGKSKTVS